MQVLQFNPADSTAKTFLWSLANTDDCRAVAVDTYKRLSLNGDFNTKHRLALLTGLEMSEI